MCSRIIRNWLKYVWFCAFFPLLVQTKIKIPPTPPSWKEILIYLEKKSLFCVHLEKSPCLSLKKVLYLDKNPCFAFIYICKSLCRFVCLSKLISAILSHFKSEHHETQHVGPLGTVECLYLNKLFKYFSKKSSF